MNNIVTDNFLVEAETQGTKDMAVVNSVTIPEDSKTDLGIALLLFVASCLYLSLYRNFIFWQHDEGIVLQGAVRIINGQIPYHDFFAYYTPGSYFWMAFLFRIFGTSILVGRTALMLYGGVYAAVAYLLARRVASRASSFLIAYLVIATCMPQRFITLHNWDSTLWALAALYCAVRALEGGSVSWVFATGSFTAITCLFEQSKGAGLTLGLCLGFLVVQLRNDERRMIPTRRNLVALLLGFCWPLVGTALYFGQNHALLDMAHALWWPFTHYSTVARVPYGFVPWWESAVDVVVRGSWISRVVAALAFTPYLAAAILPLIMLGIFGLQTVRLRRNRDAGARTDYCVLVSAAGSGLLLSLLGTGRPELAHLTFMAPISLLPIAWLFGDAKYTSARARTLYTILWSWLFASATVCGLALLSHRLAAHYTIQSRRGTVVSDAPDQVVPYMEQHLLRGQRILAYPILSLYYFLTNTYNVSRYEWMQPGLQDPEEFADVLRSLERERPEVVLFSPDTSESLPIYYPWTPLAAFAAKDPVADFILAHYRPCAALRSGGEYHVVFMIRKGLDCPPQKAQNGPVETDTSLLSSDTIASRPLANQ